jgi:hypothetical protein
MKQIIGFLPSKPTEDHLRVKNLTGRVIEATETKVVAEFDILVNKKETFMRVEYPFSECESHFVNFIDRKHNLTFHEFCNELKGLIVFYKGRETPKWQLFWSNVSIETILLNKSGFMTMDKPANYNLN